MGRLESITGKLRRFLGVQSEPRVLVAEDDESVRVLCAAALSRAGYAVVQAADGREALQKLEEGGDFVAVLLDLGMPYVHGSTVINVIERRRPDLLRRLIVMTGVHEAAVDPFFGRVGAVMRKPLTVEQIQAVVRRCSMNETMLAAATVAGETTARV
jgi:DNA-binding NtrC family response regulator